MGSEVMNKTQEALRMARQHIIERKGRRGGAVCYIKTDEEVIKAINEALEQPTQTACEECIGFNNKLAAENDDLKRENNLIINQCVEICLGYSLRNDDMGAIIARGIQNHFQDKVGCVQHDCDEAREKQEPVSWISVEDRLPKLNEDVLCALKHSPNAYHIHDGSFNGKRWRDGHGFEFFFRVTHWMPLPKSPNETNTHPQEQLSSEPVAWWDGNPQNLIGISKRKEVPDWMPLYDHPTQWHEVTNGEILKIAKIHKMPGHVWAVEPISFANAVLAKSKEKNGCRNE